MNDQSTTTMDKMEELRLLQAHLGIINRSFNNLDKMGIKFNFDFLDSLDDQFQDHLADLPFPTTQDELLLYLDLCREDSWDIASALPHPCPTEPNGFFHTDIMYNPNGDQYRTQDEEDRLVIAHFKDIHNLDLTDEKINWSFDT
jgi:hypothetical protein